VTESLLAVRTLALERHCALDVADDAGMPAADLLELAYRTTGIVRRTVPVDDRRLCGAEALLDQELPPSITHPFPDDLAQANQAHEFGHRWLDREGPQWRLMT
jgi:hypothetical protein